MQYITALFICTIKNTSFFLQGLNLYMTLTFDISPWNSFFIFKILSSKVLQPFVKSLQSLKLWLLRHSRLRFRLLLWIKIPAPEKFFRSAQNFMSLLLQLIPCACQIWNEINNIEKNYLLQRHQTTCFIPRNEISTLWYLYPSNYCSTYTNNVCIIISNLWR